MTVTISIELPYQAPANLEFDLDQDLGMFPRIKMTRGVDPSLAYPIILTTLTIFLTAMVENFGSAAADKLRSALTRLREAAPDPAPPELWLQDETSGTTVVLDQAAITDELALPELMRLDLDVFAPGVKLYWRKAEKRWQPMRLNPAPDTDTTPDAADFPTPG
jgi:hypothetical protein